MTSETHEACKKHLERAIEEAFRRFPDDPYRALAWLLHAESSLPARRADFFLLKFVGLRKVAARYLTSSSKPESEAPSPPEDALRKVLGTLFSALACLSPSYTEALALTDEHGITVRHLLEFRKKVARGT